MLISVIMPSYNHAEYILASIDSVLAQTISEIELIIVDDGSEDNSQQLLRSIDDPRVRVKLLDKNVGACAAMNVALEMAHGELIAVCNSDDIWQPHKIERQLAILQGAPGIGAVFTDVSWVDDKGNALPREKMNFFNIFDQQNRSRGQWMRRLIMDGNCLCHPSVLVRRTLYDKVGFYDNRFRQLPDYDMWLRILLHCDVYVLREQLLKFRWFADGSNASASRRDNSRRDVNERALILRNIIAKMDTKLWLASFGSEKLIRDDVDLQIEKTLFLLGNAPNIDGLFRNIGLEWAFALLSDPNAARRMEENHNFTPLTFHNWMGSKCVWLPEAGQEVPRLATSQIADRITTVVDPRTLRTHELIDALKYRFRRSIRKLAKRHGLARSE